MTGTVLAVKATDQRPAMAIAVLTVIGGLMVIAVLMVSVRVVIATDQRRRPAKATARFRPVKEIVPSRRVKASVPICRRSCSASSLRSLNCVRK